MAGRRRKWPGPGEVWRTVAGQLPYVADQARRTPLVLALVAGALVTYLAVPYLSQLTSVQFTSAATGDKDQYQVSRIGAGVILTSTIHRVPKLAKTSAFLNFRFTDSPI